MLSFIFCAALFLLLPPLVAVAALSRHRKKGTGDLSLTGALAEVTETLNPVGAVIVNGELWAARSATGESIGGGERVRVVSCRQHLLEVSTLTPVS